MGTLAKDSESGLERAVSQFFKRIYAHPVAVRLGTAWVILGISVVAMAAISAIIFRRRWHSQTALLAVGYPYRQSDRRAEGHAAENCGRRIERRVKT